MNSSVNNSTRNELLELFNSIIGTVIATKSIRAKSQSSKKARFFLFSFTITSTLNIPNTSDTSPEVYKKSKKQVFRNSSF